VAKEGLKSVGAEVSYASALCDPDDPGKITVSCTYTPIQPLSFITMEFDLSKDEEVEDCQKSECLTGTVKDPFQIINPETLMNTQITLMNQRSTIVQVVILQTSTSVTFPMTEKNPDKLYS